jgi:hypothetical protein
MEYSDKEVMVSVYQEEANAFCEILTLLGMDEEGDPVAEVKRLIDLEKFGTVPLPVKPEPAGSNFSILIGHADVGAPASELYTTIGIDVAAVSSTPCGECSRVNISFDDGFPFAAYSLSALFGLVLPLQESPGQQVGIGKNGETRIVISFVIPSNTNGLNLLCHG